MQGHTPQVTSMPKTKSKRKAKATIQRTEGILVSTSKVSSSTSTSANDGDDDNDTLLTRTTLLNLSDNDIKRGKELASTLYELFKETVTGPDKEQFEVYSKWIAKYFRNKFKFFGVKAPLKRSLQKEWLETCQEELKDQG